MFSRGLLLLLVSGVVLAADPTCSAALAVAPDRSALRVHLSFTPGWHAYWTNPGDSGLPPRLTWTLPPGWQVGAPRFPAPERHEAEGLVSFIHPDRLVLEIPVLAAPPVPGGVIEVLARVLVCQSTCVPVRATARLTLDATGHLVPHGAWTDEPWPQPLREVQVTGRIDGRSVVLAVRGRLPHPGTHPLVPAVEGLAALGPAQVHRQDASGWDLLLPLAPGQDPPDRFQGLLLGAGPVPFLLDVPLTGAPRPAAPTAPGVLP